MQSYPEAVLPPLPEPKLNGPTWWAPVLARPLRRDPRGPFTLAKSGLPRLLTRSMSVPSVAAGYVETDIVTRQGGIRSLNVSRFYWQDLNDPVGNTLTTAARRVSIITNFQNRGGMRKKMLSGATLEAAQRSESKTQTRSSFSPAIRAKRGWC